MDSIRKIADLDHGPILRWYFALRGYRIIVQLVCKDGTGRPRLSRTMSITATLRFASRIEETIKKAREDKITVQELGLTRGSAQCLVLSIEFADELRKRFDNAAYAAILWGHPEAPPR
jgi:hypothetical protein